jgi:hypothetical protein
MNEICYMTVYQGSLGFGRKQGGQGYHCPVRSVDNWCILAAEGMGRGIYEREIVSECTSFDFPVIVGIAPTTEATFSVRVEDRAVFKVGCVCRGAN